MKNPNGFRLEDWENDACPGKWHHNLDWVLQHLDQENSNQRPLINHTHGNWWRLCTIVSAPAISPGQKWWWIVLENKSFMQSMRRLSMHSWEIQLFFLFEEGGEGIFFSLFSMCSHDVPMVFLLAYQRVPQVVPQNVHNSSMSDVSHMVCPKFNSHHV